MPEEFLAKGASSVIIIIIAVFLFMFWVAMVVDCARKKFKHPIYKILWLIALAFLQTMAALVYCIAVRRRA